MPSHVARWSRRSPRDVPDAASEDGEVLVHEHRVALDDVLVEVGEVVLHVGAVLGREHRVLVAEVVQLVVEVVERRLGVLGRGRVAEVADRLADLLAVSFGRVLLAAPGRQHDRNDGEGEDEVPCLGHRWSLVVESIRSGRRGT